MVTRLQASLCRNHDSIPSIDKRLFASPKHPDQIWAHQALYLVGTQELFSEGWSTQGMMISKVSGALPLLPSIPSRYEQGQVYHYILLYLLHTFQ